MSRVLVIYSNDDRVGPYRDALEYAGIEPVLAHVGDAATLDGCDGLLLTGGVDVDPALYGAKPHAKTEDPDRSRDQVELLLYREAMARDLPVLAICRGMQLMNVAEGGTLIQHLDTVARHQLHPENLATPAHTVTVEPGTRLFEIAGASTMEVNSRHHQAVEKLAPGLRVSAVDPEDGVIEALERPDKRFALAVQWHPENQARTDAAQLRLFTKFREAVETGNKQ